MKICMIGAGYVGLVSAACLAEFGWSVVCVDKDEERIGQLSSGKMPIYEPGLDVLVSSNVSAGRLHFSSCLGDSVNRADLVFLAVGTPVRRGDGYADLSYVFDAVQQLAPHISRTAVIATKSTVPVGTSREIERLLRSMRPDGEFAVCSNPEFLREGSAIFDFTHPDRVLVGCDSRRGREVMEALYQPLALRNAPIVFVSRESAELAKYAANSFLAMKVTFINEISDLCEAVGADIDEVATAVGADGRIGPKFLHPGPGFGGSCFPKDLSAIIRTAREAKTPLTLIEQVVKVNTERKIAMVGRIEEALGGSVRDKTIAILGITYKPNTDDMRDSPSLVIVPLLQAKGANIRAFDPQGRSKGEEFLTNVLWCNSVYEAATGADALVTLTEWNEFRAADLGRVKAVMQGNVLVDLRNVFQPVAAASLGFAYGGIGRGLSSGFVNGGSSPRSGSNRPFAKISNELVHESAEQSPHPSS
jgi:UDPglucose 6-dehydrogenase